MNKIDREIVRLSVPAVVSNVTVPLLGICDTAVTGHLGSESYLAAIAVGTVMLNVVFWIFGFLRMGTTGLTANSLGADDDNGVRRILTTALALALALGTLLITLRRPLLSALLAVVGAEEGVENLVEDYFLVCIWEAPAALGVMALSGWFVGMQSTVYPMVIAVSVNIVNILLSVGLAFGAGMGFMGVAWGTLAANWFGLLLALVCVARFRRGKRVFAGLSGLTDIRGLRKFFSVNANLFFRSACIAGVSLGVTAAGARIGETTLAVNAVLMQFFTFFSFFMDGIVFSAEAMVGRHLGAGDYGMLALCVRRLLVWTLAVALMFTVAYGAGNSLAVSLLTDQPEVKTSAALMWGWIVALPVVSAWAFLYDGFYVGITDTGRMLWATLAASVVFFIVAFVPWPWIASETAIEGNRRLWSAFLAYLGMRGILLGVMWPRALHIREWKNQNKN